MQQHGSRYLLAAPDDKGAQRLLDKLVAKPTNPVPVLEWLRKRLGYVLIGVLFLNAWLWDTFTAILITGTIGAAAKLYLELRPLGRLNTMLEEIRVIEVSEEVHKAWTVVIDRCSIDEWSVLGAFTKRHFLRFSELAWKAEHEVRTEPLDLEGRIELLIKGIVDQLRAKPSQNTT